jgi:hypothetical protein
MLEPLRSWRPRNREEWMYPPRFDYLAPTTVEEVVAALGEHEGAR